MKTIPALLLMASVWLASPTPVWAFYNPSAGRWLSRDPVGENGGKNVNGFVRNSPVIRMDFLGLSEADYFKWTSWPLDQRIGTPEVGGATWATYNGGDRPQNIKFNAALSGINCCWKVHVTSEWGAKGWYDPSVPDNKAHEEQHYELIHLAYDGFVDTVKTFDRTCMAEGQARCYQKLVGKIADAAGHEALYSNLLYDCNAGDASSCEGARRAEEAMGEAWRLVNEGMAKCYLLEP